MGDLFLEAPLHDPQVQRRAAPAHVVGLRGDLEAVRTRAGSGIVLYTGMNMEKCEVRWIWHYTLWVEKIRLNISRIPMVSR